MTMTLTIRTNKHERQFQYRNEVPEKVLKSEFDWLGEEDGFDGFIHYRGCWYHLSQFMRLGEGSGMDGWDGYSGDSYFSGVLIKLSDDGETYQIATYFS